jgi:PAS domain S-box-containing protein
MAEVFARSLAPRYMRIVSAGDKHHRLNEYAIEAMKDTNLQMPAKVPYTMDEIKTDSFDLVVTMCNHAREICPTFPGAPARLHWGLPDPGKTEPARKTRAEIFEDTRNEIQIRVASLFRFGFLESIREMRSIFGSLLNNLTDGVMAHDMNRRIFFFNKAAEEITGYSSSEVVGQDCHELFPNKFCGGYCSYCDEQGLSQSNIKYQKIFVRKNGEKRNLEMSSVSINHDKREMGAMIIFKDVSDVTYYRKRLEQSSGFNGIVGQHISMTKVFDSIKELADVKVPILIQGDTGTGKEMVAMALHNASNRASGPFVPVNCGALPEGTLESELFGHVKGAFTGAVSDRKGRFELADKGTILLDEIGEISANMQVKLLRVLQEKSFFPVGGEKPIHCDVRVICATNRNLKLLMQQNLFREDLYYRLAVVPIFLPTLAERRGDIKLLIEHFLDKYSADTGKRVREVSLDALEVFEKYLWPGNVRELSNAVQYGMIKCSNGNGILLKEHLPPEILVQKQTSSINAGRPQKISAEEAHETLERAGGNKAKAAKLLGISRTTLYRIIESGKV